MIVTLKVEARLKKIVCFDISEHFSSWIFKNNLKQPGPQNIKTKILHPAERNHTLYKQLSV